MSSVLFDVNGLVRMSAENPVGIVLPCMLQSACRDFWRHPQPAGVQSVDEPHDRLVLEIQLLQLQIE